MIRFENPYQALASALQPTIRPPVPPLLKLAVALYWLSYALGLAVALLQGFNKVELFLTTWVLIGVFTVGISVALLRGYSLARGWILAATILVVITSAAALPWPLGELQGNLSALRVIARIAVGCLMFAPSVIEWFSALVKLGIHTR